MKYGVINRPINALRQIGKLIHKQQRCALDLLVLVSVKLPKRFI
jgi:hypothetical protein